ncbi:MAG: BamA/TamA family outer membrane protein, partial [Nannocystaceae bacterium]
GQLKFFIDEGPRIKIRDIDIQRTTTVPQEIAVKIRRNYGRVAELKRGGQFTEGAFDHDITALLEAYHDNGYLCANATAKVAFWKDGLTRPGEHATVDLATIHSQTGAASWLERSMSEQGLATIRAKNRARIYLQVEVDPGPRVLVSSAPEVVRYLEVPIPNSRDVSDLPIREQGAWGPMRMLYDSQLRTKSRRPTKPVPVSPGTERKLEELISSRYRNSGYPLADTKIRWIYQHPVTKQDFQVPFAKGLTDQSVGMCEAHRSGTGVVVTPEINVYEGKKGKFGDRLIRGNFKTRDWVLRREIEFNRGDVYSQDQVEQTQAHIDGTGVAQSVAITPHPVNCDLDSTGNCVIHEVIEIREAKDISMEVSGGLGLATLDPVYVFLSPSFPNVFGTAWDLDLHGHFGFDVSNLPSAGLLQADCSNQPCFERSVRGNLVRPRFVASPLTLKLSGQVQQRATPARGEVVSVLGSLGFSWPISKRWQLYFGYLIQAANISKDVYKPTTNPNALVINRRDAIVTDRTGALQVGATYTNIEDNPFNPEDGFIATADFMFASPIFGGRDWWLRGELSWQQFLPIPRTQNRLNFRYALRYGHAVPLRGLPFAETTSIPEVWRYFGGGTVDRGIRGVTPETMLVDVEEIQETNGLTRLRYTPVGGHIRALGTLALQVVSVRDFIGGKLAHSLFYDFGVLAQKWQHVQLPRDLRHSVGVNFVKWNIRIVTIAVGYAVLVPNVIAPGNVRPTDDQNGRFVFDVGVTF